MASKTKEKKDPMLTGWMFSYSKEKNPYDFITDPETGRRPDQYSPPSSFIYTHLTDGIEYATIPPLAVWKEGEWLNDMDDFDYDNNSVALRPKDIEAFDVWVTSGEGTPGNLKYRLYRLPKEISRANLAANSIPKHPMMWPSKLKKRESATKWVGDKGGSGYGTGYGTGYTSSSTWQKPKEKDAGLPMGTRIRCTKCGHWYRPDDLPGHIHCCPQVNEFSDWAIKCECCFSMDDTAKVKDGYPREAVVSPEPEPVVEADASPVEDVSEAPATTGGDGNGAGTAAS